MKSPTHELPLELLAEDQQVRDHVNPEDVKRLAHSIEQSGLWCPIIVRQVDGGYKVLDGHQRVQAFRLLGRSSIPALVREEPLAEPAITESQLAINTIRIDLNPIERAKAIDRLIATGNLTLEAAGSRLNLTSAQLSKAVALLKLPAALQDEVSAGKLAADAAYQLSRIEDPQKQASLAAEVLGRTLSRDALARKLKRSRRSDEGRAAGSGRVTAALGGGRSVTLVGKGLTLDSMIEWLDQLIGRARKAKSQTLTLETFIRTLRDQSVKA